MEFSVITSNHSKNHLQSHYSLGAFCCFFTYFLLVLENTDKTFDYSNEWFQTTYCSLLVSREHSKFWKLLFVLISTGFIINSPFKSLSTYYDLDFQRSLNALKVQQLAPFNILWKSLSESAFVIREPWLLEGLFIFNLSLTIQLSIHSCLLMQLGQRHLHFISSSLWLGVPHLTPQIISTLWLFFFSLFFPPFMVSLEVWLSGSLFDNIYKNYKVTDVGLWKWNTCR